MQTFSSIIEKVKLCVLCIKSLTTVDIGFHAKKTLVAHISDLKSCFQSYKKTHHLCRICFFPHTKIFHWKTQFCIHLNAGDIVFHAKNQLNEQIFGTFISVIKESFMSNMFFFSNINKPYHFIKNLKCASPLSPSVKNSNNCAFK